MDGSLQVRCFYMSYWLPYVTLGSPGGTFPSYNALKDRFADHKTQEFQKRLDVFLRQFNSWPRYAEMSGQLHMSFFSTSPGIGTAVFWLHDTGIHR